MQNVLTQKEKLKDSMEVMLIDVRVMMGTLETESIVPMKKQVIDSVQFCVVSFSMKITIMIFIIISLNVFFLKGNSIYHQRDCKYS